MTLLRVLVLALVVLPASGCGSRPGTIEGRAVSRGTAVAGAAVEVYLTSERGRVPSPFASAASGALSGQLQEGDLSATAPTDPVVVPASGYLDLGELVLHQVDAGLLTAKGGQRFEEPTATVLEGRVLDSGAKPRAGQFVFVYGDEGMIGRPEATVRTGTSGEFEISLPGGGKYYIGARSRSGGPRQPGEWAGRLTGTPDSGLEVLAGRRVKGLTIVMEQVW